MHVLVVGIPPTVQAYLARTFQSAGHTTETADHADDAISLARHTEFSVVLVNLQLSESNGNELIRRLRTAGLKLPVIAVSPPTMRSGPRVAAFAAGADDVVTHPVDAVELVARMQAVVRRAHGHSDSVLTAGPLKLCLVSHSVTVSGRALDLTGKENAVLELLMFRKNTPLSKDAFLAHLYRGSDEIPCDKIIDVFVCKIRKKLAASGVTDLIKTVWGRGYMISDPRREENVIPRASILPMQETTFA